MSKKVLITSRSFGSISSTPVDILENAGLEVVHKGKDFNQEEFEKIVPEFDALIIGAHPFPEEVMAKCSKMQIICKHGAGLDNIHLEKAKEMGITVCNAPGTNSNAVADLAMSFMLACARKIVIADKNVHAGTWKTVTGVDVYAKTLGLFGFGAIAKNVARRAHGFSMKVLAYDPYVKEVPEEFKEYVTLCDKEEIFKTCDFLSVHMPLTDETRDMVSAKEMNMMKEGSIIINTARGGIVNEKDLYEAVSSGHIAAAALDVSEKEPMDAENPLRTLENVIITPHIGMYSKEAIEAVSVICAKNVVAKVQGEELQFQVV
ncbi:MAG: phosphoglycerate dehydrogenase [Lachnospiraceae bacterium]|jgi:D-3-phosphoglycerate dehydrogenase|nr:phosphoglycerate dehydrogenase [Lachnospiraceae bacterium]